MFCFWKTLFALIKAIFHPPLTHFRDKIAGKNCNFSSDKSENLMFKIHVVFHKKFTLDFIENLTTEKWERLDDDNDGDDLLNPLFFIPHIKKS